ncbi:interleukin-6 receptor subunit beta [Salminus brasiliensis]|uniref:interleukin-6 receptor subunit beta n=1 Tax=Salminus brasiliensis TaxID=930266 RepID=UPI003B82FC1A
MTHRHTFCLLSCLVYLGHYGFSHWHEKQMKSYSYEELTVPGEDLEECENQKNVCVLHNTDCMSVPSLRKDMFSNISCHYLVHEKKFGCKWIHLKDVKSKLTHSFIFSQTTEISHCPSIFNVYGKFNLTIKSKDDINKIETYSEVYTVLIQNITYAPQPTITSVSAAETLLKVTWTTQWYTDKCQMRYKNSTMEQLIEVPVKSINKKGTEIVHVINGLQAFSQYNLTVACKGGYGLWSEWSAEVQAMTLEDGPTASPQVSYCVESLDKRLRTQEVLLVWKALEINEAQGVILGYEVMYTSAKQQSPIRIITTDLKARLVVAAGDYNISLMAFNSAGQSPVHHVGISSVFCESLPRVKGLWASSKEDSLRLRWEIDKIAASVSEFAIEWYSSGDAASKQWKRVNGTTFSAVLKESIKKLETYSISVYPLYDNLCGLPESIQANLESGTLVDIVQLQRVNMTKTSVTVQWVWEEKVSSTNILQYTIALVGGTETTSFLVFPHQHQHSFSKLQRNVKYSVYIYAETESGKFSKAHIEFTTPLIENDEIVKAALPVVILIFGFGIFSVLSRTIYKDYFFPNIANPSHSLIGHWLLNPLRGRDTVVSVLKLEDFSMTNQFTERCLIQIEHQKSLEKEDYDENMILTKTYLPDIDPVENSDDVENSQTFPVLSEYVDLPLIPDHCGYVENFQIPDD